MNREEPKQQRAGGTEDGPGGPGGAVPADARFFAHSPDPSVIMAFEGRIRAANPALAESLGYAEHELKGVLFFDLVHLDDREMTREYFAKLRHCGRPQEILSTRCLTKDGTERWFAWNMAATPGKDLVCATGRDVTGLVASEEAWRAAEEQQRAILEGIEDTYYENDLAGHLTFLNSRVFELTGYTREELLGVHFSKLYADVENIRRVAGTFSEVFRTGVPSKGTDWRLRRKDGAIRTIEASAALIRNSQGEPTGFRGIARDVTERRRAEEELRLQAVLLDQIGDLVTATDLEGRITYVNQAVCDDLQKPRHALVGQSVEAYGDDPEIGATQRDIIRLTRENGRWSGEVVNIRDDGSRVVLLARTWLVRDSAGTPTGMCGVSTDITELKEAQASLSRSQANIREMNQLLTALHAVTAELTKEEDFDGVCRRAIELGRERLGFERLGLWFLEQDRLRGAFGIDEQGNLRDERDILLPISEALRPDEIHASEHGWVYREQMEISWFGVTMGKAPQAAAALWDGGQAIGFMSTDSLFSGRPITANQRRILVLYASALGHLCTRKRIEQDARQMEQQFQQAQKLESLGVLAGGIAHDFNNLLMGILGNADLALLDSDADSPTAQSLSEIQKAAQRAAELCRQLLAYSGKGQFLIEEVNPSQLVSEMGELLRVSIPKKITLNYDLGRNVPAVKADATQLRQVVMNLILNAADAIGENQGVVSIRTGTAECGTQRLRQAYLDDDLPPGQYVYIEVADTGCGMDKETIRRIFDPFFTTKFTGRGLGLAAVLGIVRTHHGALSVESAPGRGSKFTVLLPPSETVETGEETGPQRKANDWRGSGEILVVDDEESVRSLARRYLERIGYRVAVAASGAQALREIERRGNSLDAVLLDMNMPDMNGREAFEQVKERNPHLPVVLTSGYGEEDAVQRFNAGELAGFLQKPYAFSDLAEAVQAAIGKNPAS